MEPWIIRPKPMAEVQARLLCFPFPGGSASTFTKWVPLLHPHVELCAVQLPGRQKRITEAPYRNVQRSMESLCDFLAPYLDVPYAIYGDCAGGFLAFELCKCLRARYGFSPFSFFVSCCRAPHLRHTKRILYNLEDQELKREMIALGVVPEWLQQNDRILSGFLPLIRADFEMVETYCSAGNGDFTFPITAIFARGDSTCTLGEMEQWKVHSDSKFCIEEVEGNHNITETQPEMLTSLIGEYMEMYIPQYKQE